MAAPLLVSPEPVACWRWDKVGGKWPPLTAHQDGFEPQEACDGASGRSIRWDDDFRMSRLTDVYRSKLNEDSCHIPEQGGASDGICNDGGEGDATHFAHGLIFARSMRIAHKVRADGVTVDEFQFFNIVDEDMVPSVGQFVYMHSVSDNPGSGECFATGSSCTHQTVDKRSSSGKLLVTDTNVFLLSLLYSGKFSFTAESVAPSKCDVTSSSACAAYGGDTSIFGCTVTNTRATATDTGPDVPCSDNVWAVGFTAGDPSCAYGTE